MMKMIKMLALCLMLFPLTSNAEPSLDLPGRLSEQLETQPGRGKLPVYAISMEIDIGGDTLSKSIGVLAGDTAVLSFMDGDGREGYEIRIDAPENTNRLGGISYGKMKLMVLRTGEQKEILAEPVLMLPLNGDRLQVELGSDEEEGLSIDMLVRRFFIDENAAEVEKSHHACAIDATSGRKNAMNYPYGDENCCGGYCTIGPYRKYQCCGVVWCCICGPCCQVR